MASNQSYQYDLNYPQPGGQPGNQGYSQPGGQPGNQGYPQPGGQPGNQGYPPPGGQPGNQGYPPPGNQGYPQPGGQPGNQGHPPPGNQGYPQPGGQPGNQGYPPHGQVNQSQFNPQPFPEKQYSQDDEVDSEKEDEDPQQARNDLLRNFHPEGASLPPSYQECVVQPGFLPPPAYNVEPSAPPEVTSNSCVLSEEEVRDAFIDFATQQCCYGTSAAKNCKINTIVPTTAIHYILETFTEKRKTDWAFEPFKGQMVDGPQFGAPPGPWDIPTPVPIDFKAQEFKQEVPHTASVCQCGKCSGSGIVPCVKCFGRGRIRCRSCFGRGHKTTHRNGETQQSTCVFCHGSGRVRCHTCTGSGIIPCFICTGSGQLKYFIELTVNWTNHKDDHIDEHTDLPDNLIADVEGEIILCDTQFRISPVSTFPVAAINQAAGNLMQTHMNKCLMERILKQRQTIRAVPCSECGYDWKGKLFTFFVYGNERKVHVFKYPQSCCWGCSLL